MDLIWCISMGAPPKYFSGEPSWSSMAETMPEFRDWYCTIDLEDLRIHALLGSIDTRLQNVFLDLQSFSRTANELINTKRRMPSEYVQGMITSAQYRLLSLQYGTDQPLAEGLRLGMLAFLATVFLQLPGARFPYHYLTRRFREIFDHVDLNSSETHGLVLWLLVIAPMVIININDKWIQSRLKTVLGKMSYNEYLGTLDRLLWIQIVHEIPAREIYDVTCADGAEGYA
jgi:hypothetical protein